MSLKAPRARACHASIVTGDDDGEPDGAAGADVAPAGRHRPPPGVQGVRLRQHDGDQHPGAPRRAAAGADPAGVPRRVQPGPGPADRVRAQRPPQARHAAVDPGPAVPRRHHPEAGPDGGHHRPPRRHRGHLLPHPLAAPHHPPDLPRPVRMLRRARRHRAHHGGPPAAAAGVPGDPAARGPWAGGPVAGRAGREGALQGRGAAAGHGRARLRPGVQRAQLGAPGRRGAGLPPHVRPVAGEGRQGRDVGELRLRSPHRAPVRRRHAGEVLRKGASQGDEGPGDERLGADTGGGDACGGGHAVHQGRVPPDVQALPRRRHPRRDLRQLPHIPALPRRPRPRLLTQSTSHGMGLCCAVLCSVLYIYLCIINWSACCSDKSSFQHPHPDPRKGEKNIHSFPMLRSCCTQNKAYLVPQRQHI